MNKTINTKLPLLTIILIFLLSPLLFATRVAAQVVYRYQVISSSSGAALRIYKEDCPSLASANCNQLDFFRYDGQNSNGARIFVSDGSLQITVSDSDPSNGTLQNSNASATSINILRQDIYEDYNFSDTSGNPSDNASGPVASRSECESRGGTWTGGGVDICTLSDGSIASVNNPSNGSGGTGAQQDDVPPAPEAVGVFNHSNEAYEASNCKTDGAELNDENCRVLYWINVFINALTVIFGVIAVVMIGVGGVQYSFARDNPQQSAAAKERIRNVIIAIVAYVFIYGFIQYIVPGGIL